MKRIVIEDADWKFLFEIKINENKKTLAEVVHELVLCRQQKQ